MNQKPINYAKHCLDVRTIEDEMDQTIYQDGRAAELTSKDLSNRLPSLKATEERTALLVEIDMKDPKPH